MAVAPFSLREDYWDTFSLQAEDREFIYNHLLEIETPLTSKELMQVLVKDRIQREKLALEKQRSSGGDIYLPKLTYQAGSQSRSRQLSGDPGEAGRQPGKRAGCQSV
jgi:hypothetical protein